MKEKNVSEEERRSNISSFILSTHNPIHHESLLCTTIHAKDSDDAYRHSKIASWSMGTKCEFYLCACWAVHFFITLIWFRTAWYQEKPCIQGRSKFRDDLTTWQTLSWCKQGSSWVIVSWVAIWHWHNWKYLHRSLSARVLKVVCTHTHKKSYSPILRYHVCTLMTKGEDMAPIK